MLDKIKQLSKDTLLYGLSTMLGRFVNFLLVPLYTNLFAPAEYGVVVNYYAFIGLITVLYHYGMDSAYLKFGRNKEFPDTKITFSTSLITVTATGLLLSLILLSINQFAIQPALSIPEQYSYLISFIIGITFCDMLAAIPFVELRLQKRALRFSVVKIINIIVNVGMNIYLILILKKGIEAVFISNLIASVLTVILLADVYVKLFTAKLSFPLLKRMLKFALPYLPGGFAAIMLHVIDRPIVEKLTDFSSLGIYQANYRLGIFMMLYINMFQYAWQPFFLEHQNDKDATKIFSKVMTYFTLVGCVITLVISLFINDLATFEIFGKSMIGKAYWSGLSIVPIVLLAYLFNGFHVIFTAGIFIKENSKSVPLIMGIGAISNVILNFILIPIFHITGAALATLGSYILIAAGFYLSAQKLFPIQYEWKKLTSIMLMLLLCGIIFYILHGNELLTIFTKLGLMLIFAASIFIFKIIDANEIQFLKSKIFFRR